MKVTADIGTNSNMQQRIVTEKSGLCSTKFHIVLQNTSNSKVHSKNNCSKEYLILIQISYSTIN